MPCKPAKARKLLRDGKAFVLNLSPFTIQLQWDCEENVQPIKLGIDRGSHHTGFCAVGVGQILISGVINHRTDIKDKMIARGQNRRQRRSRLWYRPKRFLNRASSKRSGRLPPSIKSNVEEVISVMPNFFYQSVRLPLKMCKLILHVLIILIFEIKNTNNLIV